MDGTIGDLTGTIRAANTDMAPGGCPAGSGADMLNHLTAPRFAKATPDIAILGPTAYPVITRVMHVDGDGTQAIIDRSSAGGTLGRINADGGTPDANDCVTGPAARELPAQLTALGQPGLPVNG